MPSSGRSLSRNLHMVSNLVVLWTQPFWSFMKAFLHKHDLLHHWPLVEQLNLQLYPTRRSGVELKFQSSNHIVDSPWPSPHPEAIQEPIKSCFTGTKDAPITLEIPRDLGTLCQEQGQIPNAPLCTMVLGALSQKLKQRPKQRPGQKIL